MNLAIRQHRLAPLVTVTVAALVFAILLIAVRLQWAPLESADHGAAASINRLFRAHHSSSDPKISEGTLLV
jgi:hypothetical protein